MGKHLVGEYVLDKDLNSLLDYLTFRNRSFHTHYVFAAALYPTVYILSRTSDYEDSGGTVRLLLNALHLNSITSMCEQAVIMRFFTCVPQHTQHNKYQGFKIKQVKHDLLPLYGFMAQTAVSLRAFLKPFLPSVMVTGPPAT